MSFEYLTDPARPAWNGALPGKPEPYFLRRGEGEHAMLFTDLFTVLLSGDETEGQFGIITANSPAGDIIPTHSHNETHETFYVLEGKVRLFFAGRRGREDLRLLDPGRLRLRAGRPPHAYRIEEAAAHARACSTGGFERFFQHMGTLTDHATRTSRRSSRTSRGCRPPRSAHNMQFMPGFDWPDA